MSFRRHKLCLKAALFFIIVTLLSSCMAFHSGTLNESASLTKNNFKILGNVKSESKTVIVLGFGGLRTKALISETKRKLYRSYPLNQGQAFANISVDFNKKFWLFGLTTTCTIDADVVQFLETDFYKVDTSNVKMINYTSDEKKVATDTAQFNSLYIERGGLKVGMKVEFRSKNKEKYFGKIAGLNNEEVLIVSSSDGMLTRVKHVVKYSDIIR